MRYLIVGFGNIGHKRATVIGKKLVATVDPDPKQNADYQDIHDVPLEIFDVAVLTIPQKLKYEFTEYFLSRGKYVLVEKPLVITPSQEKKLSVLAKKNKIIWHTSYNHRFEPNIVKIHKLLKEGVLGRLYHARFVYSFGNIKERLGTWRETEFSVMEEIVPHQIDFAMNFFGYKGSDFKTLFARKVESKIFDHWLTATTDNKVIIEFSTVTWKNVFSIDIYGKEGSVHMNGLRKWQGSELIIRKRILPSGVPKEKRSFNSGPDVTWKRDFVNFEKMVKGNKTSLVDDRQVSIALERLVKGAKSSWKNN